MFRPRIETENILLSITENCETLIKQTHRKSQETSEFELKRARETFSFKPSSNLYLDSEWLIRLTKLEVYIYFSL